MIKTFFETIIFIKMKKNKNNINLIYEIRLLFIEKNLSNW